MGIHLVSVCLQFVALLLGSGLCILPSAVRAEAVAGDTASSFIEIQLTREGVIAFDSQNTRWRYDFDEARFFREQVVSSQNNLRADIPQVSRRAVVERRIRLYVPSVVLEYDEFVESDIVSVGPVTIRGWAKGNVQSISKRVIVAETGRVEGTIRAPEIIVRDGAQVAGVQILTDELGEPLHESDDLSAAEGILIVVALSLVVLLGIFLIHTLMQRQLGHVEKCMREYGGRAFLVGVLTLLLIPLAVVALVITVIGVIATPLVPLVLLIAVLMGIAVTARRISDPLLRRIGLHDIPPLARTLIGVVVLTLPWVAASVLLTSTDEVALGFGIALLVVLLLIWSYPVVAGLGAASMTRLGWRPYVSFRDAVANQPPVPIVPVANFPSDDKQTETT